MKKSLALFVCIILLFTFFIGNYTASIYGYELIGILAHKMPYDLKLAKIDAKFAVYDSETELAVVFPEERFMLDKSIYVDKIEKISEYEGFVAIQIRTDKNQIKIIKIWEDENQLYSKIYNTEEFYSQYSEFSLRTIGVEQLLPIVKLWKVLGGAIIISFIFMLYLIFIDK